jgi:hypothetical protein
LIYHTFSQPAICEVHQPVRSDIFTILESIRDMFSDGFGSLLSQLDLRDGQEMALVFTACWCNAKETSGKLESIT